MPVIPHESIKPARGRKAIKVEPEAILEAALQVFSAQGVSGASIRAIAKAAGCDPALIYYHFGSKEGIFDALLDRLFGEIRREITAFLEASVALPFKERVQQLMMLLARLLREQGRTLPGIVRGEVVRGAEDSRPAVARRLLPLMEMERELFAEGVRNGNLRSDLPLPLMPLFFMRPLVEIVELVPAMAPHLGGYPPDGALDLALAAWFDLFWRGIAADPSRSSR